MQLESLLAAQGGKGVADVTGVYVDPLARDDQGADAVLMWTYNNTGDYDQNSEVGAADIVPIAQYYGAKRGDANWAQAQVADGDLNTEVGSADIVPIAQNFNSVVNNYVVEADIDGAGDWRPVANVPFSAGAAPGGEGNLEFTGTVPFGAQAPGGAAGYRVYAGPEVATGDLYAFPDLGWSAMLTCMPLTGYDPMDATLAVYFFEDAGPYDVDIDFDDGTAHYQQTGHNGTDLVFTHTFNGLGTYNISGTVTNTGALGGEMSVGKQVVVTEFAAADVTDPENWVEYNMQDGESWGLHSALAEVGGFPMIVYTRDDRDEVYFARSTMERPTTLANWVQMKVDDSGTMGGKLGIAEVQDVPCIVYENTTDQDSYFAYASSLTPNSAADWNIQELDAAEPIRTQAQVAQVGGVPAVVYVTGGGLRYAQSNQPTGTMPTLPEHWDYTDIDTDGFMDFPQIVVANGAPAVAYQRADGGWQEVRYAYRPSGGTTWNVYTVDDADKNSGLNIRMMLVGDMGNPEVALAYQNVDIVRFLKYTHIDIWNPTGSGDWQTMTVRGEEQTHVGEWLGLSWFNGRPFMAYVNTGSGSEAGLQVSIANTITPAGPGDFIHGKLDAAEGYFVNEQTNVLALDDSTLFILYRTSDGLKFAYFTGP